MSADVMVEAALSGFDEGEFATFPSVPDKKQWDALDQARHALVQNLLHSVPAARYGAPLT
jgi:uncharacterized protein